MNGQKYDLERNDNKNCLHGGTNNFAHQIWDLVKHKDNELILSLKSKHLDQNFPGSILVKAHFRIVDEALYIHLTARLDNDNSSNLQTIVNLTNHSYFNLNGCEPAESELSIGTSILDHEIYSKDAKSYLEQNSDKIPTKRMIELDESIFEINKKPVNLSEGCKKGFYDHSFVFETDSSKYTVCDGLEKIDSINDEIEKQFFAFQLISKQSGVKLEMRTTNFSCHIYTGPREAILNYQPFAGICLEAQSFPNSCNEPDWLNQTLVTTDRPYSKTIIYRFSDI